MTWQDALIFIGVAAIAIICGLFLTPAALGMLTLLIILIAIVCFMIGGKKDRGSMGSIGVWICLLGLPGVICAWLAYLFDTMSWHTIIR